MEGDANRVSNFKRFQHDDAGGSRYGTRQCETNVMFVSLSFSASRPLTNCRYKKHPTLFLMKADISLLLEAIKLLSFCVMCRYAAGLIVAAAARDYYFHNTSRGGSSIGLLTSNPHSHGLQCIERRRCNVGVVWLHLDRERDRGKPKKRKHTKRSVQKLPREKINID